MSDDPFESMRRHIVQVSGAYLYLAILASFGSWTGPSFAKSIARWITADTTSLVSVAVITALSLALGYVLLFINIHNLIDRLVFGRRRKVNAFITAYLRREVAIVLDKNNRPSDRQLMQVFYSFVNRESNGWPVLRAYAFSVWEPYHVAMNFLGIATVGLIATIASALYRATDLYSTIPAAFFGLTILIAIIVSQYQLPRKLNGIAEDQLVKMSKEERADFQRVVKARLENVRA